MKNFFIYLIILPLFLSSQDNFPINGVKKSSNKIHAFTNVDIYLNHQEKVKKATLIIKNDEIINVGINIKIPEKSIIHDLTGFTICPSFIDIFSEYGQNREIKNNITTGSWNPALNIEFNSVDYFQINKIEAEKYIFSGFGLVNSLKRDGIIRGTSTLVSLALDKPNNSILSKNSALCFSFDKGSSKVSYPNSLMGSIALLRQAYYDLDWYENGEVNFNNSLEAFSRNKNLPKIFEVNNFQSIFRADKISSEFDDNYIIKTKGDEYQRVEELKKINRKLIVPLNFPKLDVHQDPYDNLDLSLRELKNWELAPYNPKILSENNIQFALTTHGLSQEEFFNNLRIAITNGLSKKNALRSLTENPARFLNVFDKVGSISKGKKANFIIFSGELFSNEFVIYENWINGRNYQINNKNLIKILGSHSLFVGEKEIDSILFKIDENELVGTLSRDAEKKQLINNVEFVGERISFSQNNNFYSGVIDGVISGEMQDSLGNWNNWKLIKNINTGDPANDRASQKKYSDILFPNMAYGFKKQPLQETVLFRNATVWTNESRGIIENCDIAIENGKIISVGKNIKKSVFRNTKDIKIIDATGKHLTSGIIDEHSHIAISKGVNEGTQAVTSEVRIGDVINANDINIYRQLAGGVTVAQLLHGSANPIGGQSAIIKLRWGQTADKLKYKKAKPFIKFALGENVKQSNWGSKYKTRFPQTRMGVEQIFIDAFSRAREYEYNSKNYRKLKISKPRKDLELDAIVEVLNEKRFITCHSYIQSEMNMLMDVADQFGFTINTFTHVLEGYKVADKLKKHGSHASTFSDWWAYKYEVNDAIPHNASILNKMGVNTAINSDDAEMGRRLNQEAAKMIKYGKTSQEDAWKMVTLNPAKMLHIDKYVGSLRKNKDADLVIWSDNPLSIYSVVEATYIDGRCYFSLDKDEKHREYISKEKNRLLNKLVKIK